MRRREFIGLVGGAAAAWPLVARAQTSKMPVIGLLSGTSFESYADRVVDLRQGLKETGFVEGQNVVIEYRSADGQYDRLPALATEFVRQRVAMIVCIGGSSSPLAAKAATATIPIVFAIGGDAIDLGLVSNLSRPDANLTGFSDNNSTLSPKRLALLHELAPYAATIGFFLNPASPVFNSDMRDLPAGARTLGLDFVVLRASTDQDIATAFSTMAQQKIAALVVANDAFFNSRRDQIVALAAHQALPAIFGSREYVARGGLISYSPNLNEMYRQTGTYAGRILKGEKPSDLPVLQPTKFELVINLKTAKALGLTVPQTLLVAADEVIE